MASLKLKKITEPTRVDQIKRDWYHVDMANQTLGRVATQIALKLMGKHKPYFAKNMDCGDYVVVTNAKLVQVTGNKAEEKTYTDYSGYPGGLRKTSFSELQERHPEEVIKRAVYGMLPKNTLRDSMMKRLYIYPAAEHPYAEKLKAGARVKS